MAATRRNICKIIIKLTTNDEEEKEFTINSMDQILLQNFAAENGKYEPPLGSEKKKDILMIKDNYYINNDVLKSIKSTKVEKIKFTFKNFDNKYDTGIVDEFYTPITTHVLQFPSDLKILKLIIQFSSEHLARLKMLGKKKETEREVDQEIKKLEDVLLTINKYTSVTDTSVTDTSIKIQDVINKFESAYKILTEKDVMTYLKSKYDNSSGSEADDFRTALSKIMLKNYSDPDTKINLNQLETYQYFLDDKYIDYIFETIQNNISAASRSNQQSSFGYRPNLLNTPEMIKQIIKENIKYIYPDKTNIDTLAESEEQNVLLFHNILYIIKKIYLLDTTILECEDSDTNNIKKKFYIKNLTMEQYNPFKLDKIKTGDYYNVIFKFRCDINYINQNPILKFNYVIDDLEILDKTNHLKTIEFEPKNFFKNQDLKKYNSIYIYDSIDYKSNFSKINKLLNTIKIQKIIKSKEEIFFNETALNEFNTLLSIDFKKDDADDADDKDDNNQKKNIHLNIIYFLKDILKLYNGKEIITNNNSYFIYDTLITGTIKAPTGNTGDSDSDSDTLKCYSIIQNKIITYDNFKKEKIRKNFFKKLEILQIDKVEPFNTNKFTIYQLGSKDKRIKRNIYYISIIFLCYKPDEKGNKPSLQKRLIGEVCLDRAKLLDKAFYDLFYSKLDIPETFLYSKLLNLQKSKQATTAKNKETLPIKNTETPPIKNTETPPIKNKESLPTLETKIIGGKNNHTQKKKKYF